MRRKTHPHPRTQLVALGSDSKNCWFCRAKIEPKLGRTSNLRSQLDRKTDWRERRRQHCCYLPHFPATFFLFLLLFFCFRPNVLLFLVLLHLDSLWVLSSSAKPPIGVELGTRRPNEGRSKRALCSKKADTHTRTHAFQLNCIGTAIVGHEPNGRCPPVPTWYAVHGLVNVDDTRKEGLGDCLGKQRFWLNPIFGEYNGVILKKVILRYEVQNKESGFALAFNLVPILVYRSQRTRSQNGMFFYLQYSKPGQLVGLLCQPLFTQMSKIKMSWIRTYLKRKGYTRMTLLVKWIMGYTVHQCMKDLNPCIKKSPIDGVNEGASTMG